MHYEITFLKSRSLLCYLKRFKKEVKVNYEFSFLVGSRMSAINSDVYFCFQNCVSILFLFGARCSSVVRAFAHGAMVC